MKPNLDSLSNKPLINKCNLYRVIHEIVIFQTFSNQLRFSKVQILPDCFKLSMDSFRITNDLNGEDIKSVIVPVAEKLTEKFKNDSAKFEAIFHVENVPPLGVKIYQVEKAKLSQESCKPKHESIKLSDIGKFLPENLEIQMGYYESTYTSGAYILRVENDSPNLPQIKEAKVLNTSIVTELNVIYQNGWSYTAKCYHKKPEKWEIQWITGKLKPNQEAFVSYRLKDFKSEGTFYTDSNGLYTVRRRLKRNVRLEANFYPVTTSIFIQEETALSDEDTQGV